MAMFPVHLFKLRDEMEARPAVILMLENHGGPWKTGI
jgi:hypothetical protein